MFFSKVKSEVTWSQPYKIEMLQRLHWQSVGEVTAICNAKHSYTIKQKWGKFEKKHKQNTKITAEWLW